MAKVMIIDINCDLGENSSGTLSGTDEAIMPYITSANIACGFHAGNPLTIDRTVKAAVKSGVSIGAHPGYPDREGFGRKAMTLSHDELRACILYQVGALKSIVEVSGQKLQHVKPHGAFYNDASSDFETAMVIARAVMDIDNSLILFGLSGSEIIRAASFVGLNFASEVFADRAYNDDGSLVSRGFPGAVLHDTSQVIGRVVKMIKEKVVLSVSGKVIPIQADTICIHGDNKMAPDFVKKLASTLKDMGIVMKSISK